MNRFSHQVRFKIKCPVNSPMERRSSIVMTPSKTGSERVKRSVKPNVQPLPMSHSSMDTQFNQLADRLRRLSVSDETQESLEQIMKMPLAELKDCTIQFGKTYLGRTYESMKSETKYMMWFAESYKHSQKPQHVKFLRFIQLHVESLEKKHGEIKEAIQAKSKAAPKTKASNIPIDLESDSAEEAVGDWDQIPDENPIELMAMQNRMAEMEEFESSEVIDPMNDDGSGEAIFHSLVHNPIAKEMWQYFASKGVKPDSPLLKTHRADVLEIYCSPNSQLTQQARAQGLWAERHSIMDGDLNRQSGRFRLYDRLLRLRPKHVWLAPRCRAWCRWNVLNMQKSSETAARIMQERLDDQIHLQLCDAVFEFQTLRHSSSHAHLEQPVGSEMLYQEEMERIMSQAWTARCDMCTAGKLQHPVTHNPMQKGTQVVTTSEIMYRSLNALRCDHSHEHDHVAGSYRDPQYGRINVSQYAELYTSVFARKIARCMKCSNQIRERSLSCLADVLVARNLKSSEQAPEAKRRKLNTPKDTSTSNSSEIQQTNSESPYHNLLQIALQHAPKVGKRYITQGEIFQHAQQLFPEYRLHGIELCKGADRLRPPPVDIQSDRWPFRLTLGFKRDGSGTYADEHWEEWGRLTRKNLIRKGIPSRLMVTLFAKRYTAPAVVVPEPQLQPDLENQAKRQCIRPETPDAVSVEVPSPAERSTAEIKSDTTISLPDVAQDQPVPNPEPSKTNRHGPKFMQLSSEERQQLMRMHNNLGHPDATVLGNVLRDQGWPQEAIDGIRDMHCSACLERQKPRLSRPSHLGQPKDFNEVVAMDAVTWTNAQGQEYMFYHMIDSGTNYHVAFACDQRPTSRQLIRLINQHWISWAGPMKQLLTDSAGEFCSEEFCTYLQGLDIRGSTIAGEAHWQLGRCERHGCILQTMLDKYQQSQPISNEDEFDIALQSCCTAKNSLSRYRGYSPEILVLGKSRHVPASNMSDTCDSAQTLADQAFSDNPETWTPEVKWFMQNLQVREAARSAFVKADHDMKLRRSLLRRQRPSREQFTNGQWVMYWRDGKGALPGSWRGPARIIMTEYPNVIWLTHMSRLYRCAPEHVRPLSEREDHDLQATPVSEQSGFPLPHGSARQLGSGFVASPLDPCAFALPRKDQQGVHGLVGIHVDDGLGAGDETFNRAIAQLEQRYPFGSKLEGDFTFTGIHIKQQWDGTIELDQTKYVEDIPPIEVDRSRRTQPDSLVTEKERQALRALVGSVQYAATNTRPDLCKAQPVAGQDQLSSGARSP
eukprot:s2448_g5.t1